MASRTDYLRRTLYHRLRAINENENSLQHKLYRVALLSARRVVSVVKRRPVAWYAQVQSARWLTEGRFEITGFAFERGIGFRDAPPPIRVWLQGPGRLRVPATVEHRRDMAASARTKDSDYDYSNTGFRAVVDLTGLFSGPDTQLRTMVRVGSGPRARWGVFEKRFGGGSAKFPSSRMVDGVQIVPRWVGAGQGGLVLTIRRPAVRLESLSAHGRTLELEVRGDGITAAELKNEQDTVPLRVVSAAAGMVRLAAEVPPPRPATATGRGQIIENVDGLHGWVAHSWYRVRVRDDQGRWSALANDLPEAELDGGGALTGFTTDGKLCIRDTAVCMVVETAEFIGGDSPSVVVRGRFRGDSEGVALVLVGPHQRLPVDLTITGDRFEAVCRLMTSTWGRPPLSPKPGSYVLHGSTAQHDWFWVGADHPLIDTLSPELQHELFRCRFMVDAARRLLFRVKIPRTDDELGFFHQRRLEQDYRNATFEPENSIFFESFYGRTSACNPRALDAVIAAEHPEITRYWGVSDNSVGVPPGAVPVVYNTKAWWQARGRSRFVIANDWLRSKFKHQPHQVVLQTWHGTMFKRIGLDRPGFDKLMEKLLKRERSKWDLLLSQNRHSSDIFRSAYAWKGPILEEGYPRNDALIGGDGRPIRDLLGIPQTDTVVLYAPTWRDDQTKAQLLLDVPALTAELGEGYTVLLRGHTRTHRSSESLTATNLIDVTTYPDITELFLASDVLITDYSSVMFDFSATGRPMIFFVPDLDDYRDSIRGVYFDLDELAPGPVLYDQALVVPAIKSAAEDRAGRYADKYDQWRQRFNPHDDGQSAMRVMKALFATEPPRLKAQ